MPTPHACRCQQRVCNRYVWRIPLRVFLCCTTNGRIRHPMLQSAAQVVHTISSPVFQRRSPLCHSSVLLGMQGGEQPGTGGAYSCLCKPIESNKDLFGQRISRQKITSEETWTEFQGEVHSHRGKLASPASFHPQF